MLVKRTIIVALALLVEACGVTISPRSLSDLEAVAESDGAEQAATAAAEAWSEAMRYLDLAREALADGDSDQAERFAELGIIHAKTAMVRARQTSAEKRLEEARRKRGDIDRELERVQSAVIELEQEMERERIRAHLEQTVDELRRRAAAEEELREAALDEQQRQSLSGARLEVAREMVGRVGLGLEVLRTLVVAGMVPEERLLPTQGALDAALEQLALGELVGVQRHVETAGVWTRRLWDELWEPHGEGAVERMTEELARVIEEAGLDASSEEFGQSVRLTANKSGQLTKQTRESIGRLSRTLTELVEAGQVRALVFVANSAGSRTRGADDKEGDARAAAIAASIVQGGFPKAIVSHRGCSSAAPLVALARGKGERIAILLVPIPVAR